MLQSSRTVLLRNCAGLQHFDSIALVAVVQSWNDHRTRASLNFAVTQRLTVVILQRIHPVFFSKQNSGLSSDAAGLCHRHITSHAKQSTQQKGTGRGRSPEGNSFLPTPSLTHTKPLDPKTLTHTLSQTETHTQPCVPFLSVSMFNHVSQIEESVVDHHFNC